MSDPVTIELSHDEALVLFEFFRRFDRTDLFRLRHNAEFVAFCKIAGRLESTLVEPFHPETYEQLLAAARDRLASGYEGLAPGVEPVDRTSAYGTPGSRTRRWERFKEWLGIGSIPGSEDRL